MNISPRLIKIYKKTVMMPCDNCGKISFYWNIVPHDDIKPEIYCLECLIEEGVIPDLHKRKKETFIFR